MLRRNWLVLVTGVAAALPVIVATIGAVAHGWVPLGDDAIIVVRAYDVLSTHPPLLGPYSTSSQLIGHPVLSPGPTVTNKTDTVSAFTDTGLPVPWGTRAGSRSRRVIRLVVLEVQREGVSLRCSGSGWSTSARG